MDKLFIYVESLEHADAYVTIGKSIDSARMKEIKLDKGAALVINQPNNAYITIISHDTNEPADFRVKSHYKAADANTQEEAHDIELIKNYY